MTELVKLRRIKKTQPREIYKFEKDVADSLIKRGDFELVEDDKGRSESRNIRWKETDIQPIKNKSKRVRPNE